MQGTERIQAICLMNYDGHLHTYTDKQFKNLRSLRYLQMGRVALSGDFDKLFYKIRWLHWFGNEEKKKQAILKEGSSLATNLHLPKLVVLQLSNVESTDHWRRWSSIMVIWEKDTP